MIPRWTAAFLVAALCAAALAAGCATAGLVPPEAVSRANFVTTLGADTVSVETLEVRGSRFEGQQVVRSPTTSIREFSGTLDDQGRIETFHISFRGYAEPSPATEAEIQFGADTATIRLRRGDSVENLRVAAPRGSIPLMGYGVALYELPLRAMWARGEASLRSNLVTIGGQPIGYSVERRAEGSYRVSNVAGDNRVTLDAQGRLVHFDGRGSTLALVAERVPELDPARLAEAFAARDAAGTPLGQLSPRDSLTAVVHGAEVSVNYGRPLRRGRAIWGELVPYEQVWRTGANQATHLRTTRDLEFGGTLVPAGTYTLWTVPTATGGELVINRQTGQWGTAHDPGHDLVRVPMRRELVAEELEQLTISIERTESGGQIRLAWDDAAYVVPFRVR